MTQEKQKPIEHMTKDELHAAYNEHCMWFGDAVVRLEEIQNYCNAMRNRINAINARVAKLNVEKMAQAKEEAPKDTAPSSAEVS